MRWRNSDPSIHIAGEAVTAGAPACTRKNNPNTDAVFNACRHPETLGSPSQMTVSEPVGVTRPRHFCMLWATGMAYLSSGMWIAAVQAVDPGSSSLERKYARIWIDGY